MRDTPYFLNLFPEAALSYTIPVYLVALVSGLDVPKFNCALCAGEFTVHQSV